MAGFEQARTALEGESVLWRTTSPGLLARLPDLGVAVRSCEEGLSIAQADGLGCAAFDFADFSVSLLDRECSWAPFLRFAPAYGFSLAQLANLLFYKGRVLDLVREEAAGGVTCVGRPEASPVAGLSMGFGRFDTLYAVLAGLPCGEGVDVLRHDADAEALEALDGWVRNRPLGRWERFLSVLNNTPGSFAFKAWDNLARCGLLRRARLWPAARRRLFVHKDCELIGESFLKLLACGAEFSRLPRLPRLAAGPGAGPEPAETAGLREPLRALALEALARRDIPAGGALEAAAGLLADRIVAMLGNLRAGLDELVAAYAELADTVGPRGLVVTNFFASPEERMFGLYCLSRGVHVAAFEHGITLGLSPWAAHPARYWGMLAAETGVYHWPASLRDIRPHLEGRQALLGGVPRAIARVFLPGVQRWLGRKWLGLARDAHVVCYVADLERNNVIYGPHVDNDLQYLRCTRSIVRHLAAAYPDSVILLKLYPTHRYPECDDFSDLAGELPNLRVVKDMDFRFIRAVADVIALSSSQSTLGWALGSGREVLFFEKQASPASVEGRELDAQVSGVSRVLALDMPLPMGGWGVARLLRG